ncbi:MAG TPA: helix-turn-helix domain-containing protein [Casimicrobiaceae bacterium]|nr:helix-turn-helix domain-containing protein [Casimicrobiaceae bacterium]
MTDPIEAAESAYPHPPATAGAKLREAREAAGWSIGDVAAQLKLAPRQVAALEEDDWARLPGRTFIRGFARNYARFLALDPDTVLALLPPPEHAPALERPSFAAARRPMGEIPVERAAKPSAVRWLVPLLLLVLAAAYGFYEYTRQKAITYRDGPLPAASAPAAAGNPAATPAAPASATTALPNPLTDAAPGAPAEPASDRGNAAPAAASDAAPVAAPASQPPPASSAAPGTDATLVLAFKGTSWAEVRDANGRVILQMTGGAGMTQTVNGTPPFELALGNAPDVAVTFRGQALDLAPYTRGNVARVSLR